jgi:DNA-directed RNA polymerase subunit K/omega
MSTALIAEGAPWAACDGSGAARQLGRFHIATLVMQRAKQLEHGARPRAQADGHKPCRLALIEVLVGAVQWSVSIRPDTPA